MPRSVPITDVRPSQLYLNADKLASVVEWFDFADPEYGPLPTYEFDGDRYLTDGHTRAFAAHLAGIDELRVRYDDDLSEKYDLSVYRTCIEWCADEGVTEIGDLAGRVLAPEEFERRWIERCQALGEE